MIHRKNLALAVGCYFPTVLGRKSPLKMPDEKSDKLAPASSAALCNEGPEFYALGQTK